ncbi:hypothetical protein KEM52_003704, partial [Ascosphaera acerosa]
RKPRRKRRKQRRNLETTDHTSTAASAPATASLADATVGVQFSKECGRSVNDVVVLEVSAEARSEVDAETASRTVENSDTKTAAATTDEGRKKQDVVTPDQVTSTSSREGSGVAERAAAAQPHTTKEQEAQGSTAAATARPAVPIVPVVPISAQQPAVAGTKPATTPSAPTDPVESQEQPAPQSFETQPTAPAATQGPAEGPAPAAPTKAAPPKSWADLVRKRTAAANLGNASSLASVGAAATSTSLTGVALASGAPATPAAAAGATNGIKSSSMRDVLAAVSRSELPFSQRVAFIEPRGLVNTGNMCYMNSVLQILAYCPPFFALLDRVGAQAMHALGGGGDFPLVDALIMFLREFPILESSATAEQLRAKIKASELEQFGDAFTPEYVYEVIRTLPRFKDMRQGHQQDAQEFLGFLLEELHEECALAVKQVDAAAAVAAPDTAAAVQAGDNETSHKADGWMEVGHKQRSAVTRSSGETSSESPITTIFGGKLRSEFRVPGSKISVTLEPYQSLQLDIGSPQVHTIVDALKNLTTPETMHGDFATTKGTRSSATKQVFIESLPPVLVLHLKRFQYDATTHGTQKIWKKIGYPLDLEIPREVLAPQRRTALAYAAPIRYRLTGVIYHHGKNASGGHYTVDVCRQDTREWIRIDDTIIRRVRPEDVAGAPGSEDESRALATALERQRQQQQQQQQQQPSKSGVTPASANIFDSFGVSAGMEDDSDDEVDDGRGWNQVVGSGSGSGSSAAAKTARPAASGTASPSLAGSEARTGAARHALSSLKDNRVAYLLFYEKVPSGSGAA